MEEHVGEDVTEERPGPSCVDREEENPGVEPMLLQELRRLQVRLDRMESGAMKVSVQSQTY